MKIKANNQNKIKLVQILDTHGMVNTKIIVGMETRDCIEIQFELNFISSDPLICVILKCVFV